MTSTDFVTYSVNGMQYSLLVSDIQRHPECYLANVIKDEWKSEKDNGPIMINRDGALFQFIFMYVCTDGLQLSYRVQNTYLDTVVAVRAEADYYNLPKLMELCDEKIRKGLPMWCKTQPTAALCANYKCVEDDGTDPDNLPNVYGRNFFPTVQTGSLVDKSITGELCIGCNVEENDVTQLLQSTKVINDDPSCANVRYWCPPWEEFRHLDDMTVLNIRVHLPTLAQICCYLAGPSLIVVTEGKPWPNFYSPRVVHHLLGYVLYIIHAAESGGAVTVTQHGVTHRIQHAGEYIVCGRDSTRQVEQIASGALVCLLFPIVQPTGEDYFYAETITLPATISSDLAVELISAARRESGVVLCLNRLYTPVFVPSTNVQQLSQEPQQTTQMTLETDPTVLQGRDALLYAALVPHFDITLVTVYVARQRGPQQNCQACVLGLSPDATRRTESTSEHCAKIAIIVPPYGVGNQYELQTLRERNSTTLFTGLYIQSKVGV